MNTLMLHLLFWSFIGMFFVAGPVLGGITMESFPANKANSQKKLPLLPKSKAPSLQIDHVNLLEATFEDRFALTVLQGLVSRQQPAIYITQDPAWHGPAAFPKWIDNLKKRGYEFTDIADPLSLIEKYRSSVKGAVLYESGLQGANRHKINALTLYCALEDAIPVTQQQNERLKLPVLFDARNKLRNGSEAYRWMYKELWPRANRSAVAFTPPDHLVLRDYLVANRIAPFWNSKDMSNNDEAICWKFIEEAEPNAAVLGCWGGYGEDPPGRTTEAELQRVSSLRGKYVLVSDGCFNLTFHSGLTYRKPKTPERPKARGIENDKIYITVSVTDGDNLQYVQQHFRSPQWWEDPNRGSVPIGWSMNPVAAELMPDILEYFQSTATPNDEFFCSTAGIGLVTPALYGKDLYSDNRKLYQEYIGLTGSLMKLTGMTMVALGDTSIVPWTRADFADWTDQLKWLDGVLGDYGRSIGVSTDNHLYFSSNNIPVIRSLAAPQNGPPDRLAQHYADAILNMAPTERPAFMHVCLVNWYYSPTMIKDVFSRLGDDYVPVLPGELFEMLDAHKMPKQ